MLIILKRNTSKSQVANAFTDPRDFYTQLPTTFLYERIKLEGYECKTMRDITSPYNPKTLITNTSVISARLPIVSKNHKYVIQYNREITEASNTILLISLIELRLKLSPDLFKCFSRIENLLLADEGNLHSLRGDVFIPAKGKKENTIEPMEISKRDFNLIRAWCKKYGFPFSIRQKLSTLDIKKKEEDETEIVKYYLRKKLVMPNVDVSFWVWEFLRKLQIVYSVLLLFYKIDKKSLDDDFNIRDNTFLNYDVNACKKLLERIFATVNLKGHLDFTEYEKGNKDMLIGYTTDNAFDLAIYSLFLFMAVSGRTLKRCPICSELFEPKHGAQKYCQTSGSGDKKRGSCYPQLYYKHKKAKQKKGQLAQQKN